MTSSKHRYSRRSLGMEKVNVVGELFFRGEGALLSEFYGITGDICRLEQLNTFCFLSSF